MMRSLNGVIHVVHEVQYKCGVGVFNETLHT